MGPQLFYRHIIRKKCAFFQPSHTHTHTHTKRNWFHLPLLKEPKSMYFMYTTVKGIYYTDAICNKAIVTLEDGAIS
jgi:hypothetical protein